MPCRLGDGASPELVSDTIEGMETMYSSARHPGRLHFLLSGFHDQMPHILFLLSFLLPKGFSERLHFGIIRRSIPLCYSKSHLKFPSIIPVKKFLNDHFNDKKVHWFHWPCFSATFRLGAGGSGRAAWGQCRKIKYTVKTSSSKGRRIHHTGVLEVRKGCPASLLRCQQIIAATEPSSFVNVCVNMPGPSAD